MSTISKHCGLLSDVSDAESEASHDSVGFYSSVSYPDPREDSVKKFGEKPTNIAGLIGFLSNVVGQLKQEHPQ